MRYDNKPTEPQSLEEEAFEQSRVKPLFKEKNLDNQPDPREDEDEWDDATCNIQAKHYKRGGSGFWG